METFARLRPLRDAPFALSASGLPTFSADPIAIKPAAPAAAAVAARTPVTLRGRPSTNPRNRAPAMRTCHLCGTPQLARSRGEQRLLSLYSLRRGSFRPRRLTSSVCHGGNSSYFFSCFCFLFFVFPRNARTQLPAAFGSMFRTASNDMPRFGIPLVFESG